MNIHKNARLTFARRLEMVQDVLQRKLRPSAAAARHEVSVPTARKWVGRYLVQGEPGLRDALVATAGQPAGDRAAYRAGDRRAASPLPDPCPNRR